MKFFFSSVGASQRLGVSDEFLSLGTGGEGFLNLTAPFDTSEMNLLGIRV